MREQPQRKPRLSISADGLYVHIGFSDTQDTILKVGGHPGPGGWRDVEHAREWVAAIRELLGYDFGVSRPG
jgi:hypothetical protein